MAADLAPHVVLDKTLIDTYLQRITPNDTGHLSNGSNNIIG
jgi:hypothetical protein